MDKQEQKIQNLILQKIRKEIIPEAFEDELKKNKISKDLFRRIKKHCIERIVNGWSYRDAWNVDLWIIEMLPGILTSLKDNLHGYPDTAIELHKEFTNIDKSYKFIEQKKNEKDEDYKFRVYKSDLERLIFLFTESDEFKTSRKNPYKFTYKYESIPSKKIPKCFELVNKCNAKEEEENEKWSAEQYNIDVYRLNCRHLAMRVLDMYLPHLWD